MCGGSAGESVSDGELYVGDGGLRRARQRLGEAVVRSEKQAGGIAESSRAPPGVFGSRIRLVIGSASGSLMSCLIRRTGSWAWL